ncbi:EAL domain-containing protein [uncultured Jatrophihabitans sp.]|uniref:EAL domain-containing protein n=1 Tax=uncultured Jatrophihabitans sp. TaxID=1610747 RepID=UPI0035CAE82D
MAEVGSASPQHSEPKTHACIGCSCTVVANAVGNRMLFATRVSHSLATLRSLLRDAGASVTQRAPGLLEVYTTNPSALLMAARQALSSVEAAEIRAMVVVDEDPDALLSAALTAPTLAQSSARIEHADLVPLLADEFTAFHSVYQPIVSLHAGAANAVIGYEALLRATTPDGPVMPDQMFAAAAQAGWLPILDRVGRTSALRGAADWLGASQLFVNFVPTSIYRPEVCLRTTEQAAEQAGLRLEQLVFEVTESEQIADIGHLSNVFDYYRERGCKVALDDLGSGFSSLNNLVLLRPDVVKLDKELVQALPNSVSRAVIDAIVQMTHSYGGLVLAECVETLEQAQAARDLGVDLGQGWLFGRPESRPVHVTGPARLATHASR